MNPFEKTAAIGTIDTGYASRAVVTIEAKWDGQRLSITADAKRPRASDIDQGGQMQDTIRAAIDSGDLEYAAGWDAARVARILDTWDRWHLNDMRPGCEHQTGPAWDGSREVTLYHWRVNRDATKQVRDALKHAETQLRAGETVTLPADLAAVAALPQRVTTGDETPPGPLYEPNTPTYTGDHYNRPSETKTAAWVKPSEHAAGILTKPCDVCGYRYGTAWKTEDVPDSALRELQEALGGS